MRTRNSVLFMVIAAFLLAGCTTSHRTTQVASNFINRQDVVATTKESYTPKSPVKVALYSKDKAPHMPYRVIGVATISKYNFLGMERNPDTLHAMMKQLAASIGGDGIIDVNDTKEAVQANVIAFQRILL